MLGRLQDGQLSLEEIHRFPSAVVRVLGSLRWDVLRVYEELKAGLREVAKRNIPILGLSVDSWGVRLRPDQFGASHNFASVSLP